MIANCFEMHLFNGNVPLKAVVYNSEIVSKRQKKSIFFVNVSLNSSNTLNL